METRAIREEATTEDLPDWSPTTLTVREWFALRRRQEAQRDFETRAHSIYGASAAVSGRQAEGHPPWTLDLGRLSGPVIEAATPEDCFAIAKIWFDMSVGVPHARARLRTAMVEGKAILHPPRCDGSGLNDDGREWSRRFTAKEA